MKTKQQLRDEAWEAYEKRLKEIDSMDEGK